MVLAAPQLLCSWEHTTVPLLHTVIQILIGYRPIYAVRIYPFFKQGYAKMVQICIPTLILGFLKCVHWQHQLSSDFTQSSIVWTLPLIASNCSILPTNMCFRPLVMYILSPYLPDNVKTISL